MRFKRYRRENIGVKVDNRVIPVELYVWKFNNEGKLYSIRVTDVRRISDRKETFLRCYYIENEKQYTVVRKFDDLDKFMYKAVLSTSSDYNYIWEIISKTFWDDYLKKDKIAKAAQEKFYQFRENNKRSCEP